MIGMAIRYAILYFTEARGVRERNPIFSFLSLGVLLSPTLTLKQTISVQGRASIINHQSYQHVIITPYQVLQNLS